MAKSINQKFADSCIAALLFYTDSNAKVIRIADAELDSSDEEEEVKEDEGLLYDLTLPINYSCKLQLLKFDDPRAEHVFWHSSAHILGQALEKIYGGLLTIGPATKNGFYYDMFIGNGKISDGDLAENGKLHKKFEEIVKEAQPYFYL